MSWAVARDGEDGCDAMRKKGMKCVIIVRESSVWKYSPKVGRNRNIEQ